jgi:rsbT antagonist protein RsbS
MAPGAAISVMRIRDVLMVAVPQDADDETIASLQERVLDSMDQHRTKGLIVDLSTVETLDSYFARTVVETARMVALMGGKTIVVGMRPSVAVTATQLGLALGDTAAALSVDRALAMLNGAAHGA